MSAGTTNAVPAGGGGLKVIASGTVTTSSFKGIMLPGAAQFILYTVSNAASTFHGSGVAMPNGLEVPLICQAASSGLATLGTITLAENGTNMVLEPISKVTVRYTAIG